MWSQRVRTNNTRNLWCRQKTWMGPRRGVLGFALLDVMWVSSNRVTPLPCHLIINLQGCRKHQTGYLLIEALWSGQWVERQRSPEAQCPQLWLNSHTSAVSGKDWLSKPTQSHWATFLIGNWGEDGTTIQQAVVLSMGHILIFLNEE